MYSHGRRLAETGGGNFRVTGSRTDPNGIVVVTGEFITPQGARNEVDVQLGIVNGLYRIRESLSIMSAWYRATVPRSHRCWRATAGNSRRCWQRCAKKVESVVASGASAGFRATAGR